ncbi:unnamed protein product [Paramecium octaurelia]|uniref:Uncharacterized protein n=1 Tax=Paramecium octaurelia TaxID=43137 RepID=A0A8S1XVX8_PAROT|nr:unnamed protein product [Paramecium octaurelia]
MQEDYKRELENYTQLWKVYTRNSLEKDFRNSLYSTLALVFVPSLVNVYYIFRQSVLKNAVRFGSIISCLMIFHYNLNKDFERFVQKDSKESNLARLYMQNISKTNVIFPYFGKETMEIVKQREEGKKQQ